MSEREKMEEVIRYGKDVEKEIEAFVAGRPWVGAVFAPVLKSVRWAIRQAEAERDDLS